MTAPAQSSSATARGSGKATAIILARAGSKGVPGKNTRDIAGRPCIAWTIDHAQRASSVGLVAVSSDDPRALEIATSMGALALARSPALATDTARIDDAAREAVLQLEHQCGAGGGTGVSPVPAANQPIVILYANVPVRPAGLIDRAVELLVRTGCDSVQSYQPVGKHHPWWTARMDARTGLVRPWEGKVLNHGVFRRQDLPPAYIPDGGIIALTREALFCRIKGVRPGPHAFLGTDRRGIISPQGSVVDIDSPIDLLVADAVLRSRSMGRRGGSATPC